MHTKSCLPTATKKKKLEEEEDQEEEASYLLSDPLSPGKMGIKLTEGAIEVSVYTKMISLVGFFPVDWVS